MTRRARGKAHHRCYKNVRSSGSGVRTATDAGYQSYQVAVVLPADPSVLAVQVQKVALTALMVAGIQGSALVDTADIVDTVDWKRELIRGLVAHQMMTRCARKAIH